MASDVPTPDVVDRQPVAVAEPQAPASSGASLRAVFARGVLWTGVAMALGKLLSLVSQYILGRMFDEDVYGLFAMAITAAMIGEVFANAGIRTVIIARGAEAYPHIARTAAAVAHLVSVLAALLVAVTAPFWAYYYYRQDSVLWLLLILALSIAISSMGVVQRAHLSSELRVGALAVMEAGSAVIRHVMVVVLAWWGFREYSFVWPIVLFNLWLFVFARLAVGRLPRSPLDRSLARELLHQGKWVVIAGIGATLIARGDYLVGGGFARYDKEWLGLIGLYFFGYQLTVSLFGLFNISMNSVMQPAFARLRANPDRQAEAYVMVLRTTVFIAAPFTIVGALVAPLLVRGLWPDGKWDQTIPVIQLFALTEAVRQLHFISVALLSARSQFRAAAFLTIVDGITTMLAALVGCLCGGLLSLTIAVASQRTVMSLVEAAWVYRRVGGNPWVIFAEVLKPLLPALLMGATAYAVITMTVETAGPGANLMRANLLLAAASVPFLGLYLLIARRFMRRQLDEAADLVRRIVPFGRRAAMSVASDDPNG